MKNYVLTILRMIVCPSIMFELTNLVQISILLNNIFSHIIFLSICHEQRLTGELSITKYWLVTPDVINAKHYRLTIT